MHSNSGPTRRKHVSPESTSGQPHAFAVVVQGSLVWRGTGESMPPDVPRGSDWFDDMNDESQPNTEREERVNRILAEFLEAERTGQGPDRGALLRQHPDLATELQSFFTDIDRFQKMAAPIAPRQESAEAVTVPPSSDAGARAEQPTIAPDTGNMDAAGRPLAPGDCVRYFGDYELLEEIARGGMGVVYKARQVSINRLVALKMILSGQFASKADVQRFRTEAVAAGNLDHPNIVPIYEVNEHQGQQYFSMKLIDGGSLAQRLGARSQGSGSRSQGITRQEQRS